MSSFEIYSTNQWHRIQSVLFLALEKWNPIKMFENRIFFIFRMKKSLFFRFGITFYPTHKEWEWKSEMVNGILQNTRTQNPIKTFAQRIIDESGGLFNIIDPSSSFFINYTLIWKWLNAFSFFKFENDEANEVAMAKWKLHYILKHLHLGSDFLFFMCSQFIPFLAMFLRKMLSFLEMTAKKNDEKLQFEWWFQ